MSEVKYPEIEVQLVDGDGNAFAILGGVSRALKQGGVSPEEIEKFRYEATSADYDNLLATCASWVTIY